MSLFSLRRLPGSGRVLRALGVSAVPATGYFGAGWSLSTLLLLYWLETVLVTLVVAILILRHRQVTRKAGHWGYEYTVTTTSRGRTTTRTGKTTFLTTFLTVMVPFTAVHGIFVAAFTFLFFPQEIGPAAAVSPQAVSDGLAGIGLFLLVSLLFDLAAIGERPFQWVEHLANRAKGRMFVTHLTILLGACAMAVFDAHRAFFVVFVVLKSLLDLGDLLPDRAPRAEVPRFAKALSRRLPKKEGRSFGDHYASEIGATLARSEANEEVRPHPPISRRGRGRRRARTS